MSYHAINQMFQSQSLRQRVIACAAQEGITDPETAVSNIRMWQLSSNTDWVAAWDTAVDGYTLDKNPNTGERPDVITDAMILSAVQAIINGP